MGVERRGKEETRRVKGEEIHKNPTDCS